MRLEHYEHDARTPDALSPPNGCTDTTCVGGHAEDHVFYVTVRDAGRHGFLLGPYDTHPEALQNVDRGRRLALESNDRAWFYAYGTASATRQRIFETIFGLGEEAMQAAAEVTVDQLPLFPS